MTDNNQRERTSVRLSSADFRILDVLVKEMHVFLNESDAVRAAIRQLGEKYGIAPKSEASS